MEYLVHPHCNICRSEKAVQSCNAISITSSQATHLSQTALSNALSLFQLTSSLFNNYSRHIVSIFFVKSIMQPFSPRALHEWSVSYVIFRLLSTNYISTLVDLFNCRKWMFESMNLCCLTIIQRFFVGGGGGCKDCLDMVSFTLVRS